MYKVKPSDLIGEIEGFPLEVVQKMVDYQNKSDVTIFQDARVACGSSSLGFTWRHSPEGFDFWDKVIIERNFDVFFKKYPKQEFNFPCIMEVSSNPDFTCSDLRVVFMQKNDRFIAWSGAETFTEAERSTDTTAWKYARIPVKKVTKAEIAAVLGTPHFQIID